MMSVRIRSCVGRLRFLLLIGGLMVSQTAFGWADAELNRISFTARADGKGYVVRFHLNQSIRDYELTHRADRVTLTVQAVNVREALQLDQPVGPIADYDLTHRNQTLTFTLFINPETPIKAQAYPDQGGRDLLIGLTYTGAAPVVTAVARPNETGASTQERQRWELDCIAVDAGHGGKDPGAGAHGLHEKDIVLGVAQKLGHYIEDRLGVRVVYTRKDDRFITLAERGKIANRAGCKLFVSIHANAAGASAYGTETYFLGMHRTETARKVMERENSVVRFEDNTEQFTEEDLIRYTMAQTGFMKDSEHLAGLIQSQFQDRSKRRSRGVKQAGFQVLYGASMPAVLVELGFITNAEEARFMRSERGQDVLASAIFRAIRAYKAAYEARLNLTP